MHKVRRLSSSTSLGICNHNKHSTDSNESYCYISGAIAKS